MFIIISSLIYLIEGAVPRPLPWIKLGFANIITIVIIYYFDFFFLMKYLFLRIIIGNLITATIFTPSFFLSLSGGVSSAIVMFLLFKFFKSNISAIGLSVAGATVHLIAQSFVVYEFLIHDIAIIHILPVILLTALVTGSITGWIAENVLKRLTF